MKSWRNLPPALLAMFAVEVVAAVSYTTYQLTHSWESPSLRWELADRGFWLAGYFIGIIGALALARRLTGLATTGFRVVAVGFALSILRMLGWELYATFHPHWNMDTVDNVSRWSFFAVSLIPLAGAVIAAIPTRRRLAVVAAVVALLVYPPPPLATYLYAWVHSFTATIVVEQLLRLAALAIIATIAIAVAPEPYPAPPADAAPGFRAIATGLWLRVIAACTFAGLAIVLVLGRGGDGAQSVVKLATMSVAVVNAIAFFIVARGAFTTVVRDVPALTMAIAATATFWCLGVTVAQLSPTYQLLYGDHGYGGVLQDRVQALSLAAPLVGVAAIAMFASAIARFAANRGLDQLRAEAQGKGLGFVTLMVASIGIQQWLLPEQRSEGSVMFFLLAAAGCSLGATVLMARLCSRAADSLHAETTLPTATLRS